MKSLWQDAAAQQYQHSALALRVYTSRLLGQSDDLVLHGGGNTSVKLTRDNIFGEAEEILYVKGSGWDLKTIEEPGFAPCRLNYLQRLATLETMSDIQMARELKVSCTDPAAPAPSVEAILHAVIPHHYVDHTHADAVVAISNTPDGEARLKALYGDRVLILPYVMPGFVLAKQVFEQTRDIDWSTLDAIILLHHGVFTFDDDAQQSYQRMIHIVDQAERYLAREGADQLSSGSYLPQDKDLLDLAAMRHQVSELAGRSMLAHWKLDPLSVGFCSRSAAGELVSRGPVTPDHSLHTKRVGATIDTDCSHSIRQYAEEYQDYFQQHNPGGLTCLDPAPRYAVWPNKGGIAFAQDASRLGVVSDIMQHTFRAIEWAEQLGGWQTLSAREIFQLEYWELEQAKLKTAGSGGNRFVGRVALISGAASGIGKACAEALIDAGACVVALDIKPEVTTLFSGAQALGLVCDMGDMAAIGLAVGKAVQQFGGIDMLISNAGLFPHSARLEQLDDESWQQSLDLNLTSHLRLLRAATPYLKLGLDPAVVFMASKNVPAPGPGAGAYSAAKAGLTQLARVAALELGGDGIRVNVIHPNAVFDTAVWTDQVLQERAAHYGMSVEQYKRNNVMGCEVTSADVAQLCLQMCGPAFARTTGAQVPIDGGNERVI